MSTYSLDQLLKLWSREDISGEIATGQLILNMVALRKEFEELRAEVLRLQSYSGGKAMYNVKRKKSS